MGCSGSVEILKEEMFRLVHENEALRATIKTLEIESNTLKDQLTVEQGKSRDLETALNSTIEATHRIGKVLSDIECKYLGLKEMYTFDDGKSINSTISAAERVKETLRNFDRIQIIAGKIEEFVQGEAEGLKEKCTSDPILLLDALWTTAQTHFQGIISELRNSHTEIAALRAEIQSLTSTRDTLSSKIAETRAALSILRIEGTSQLHVIASLREHISVLETELSSNGYLIGNQESLNITIEGEECVSSDCSQHSDSTIE